MADADARSTAVQTLHHLGRPDRSIGRLAFFEMHPDDIVINHSGVYLTAGDVRELQALLIELGFAPSPTRTESMLAAAPAKGSA